MFCVNTIISSLCPFETQHPHWSELTAFNHHLTDPKESAYCAHSMARDTGVSNEPAHVLHHEAHILKPSLSVWITQSVSFKIFTILCFCVQRLCPSASETLQLGDPPNVCPKISNGPPIPENRQLWVEPLLGLPSRRPPGSSCPGNSPSSITPTLLILCPGWNWLDKRRWMLDPS